MRRIVAACVGAIVAGMLLLVVLSFIGVGAGSYQTGLYYPYYPWYWGHHYYSYGYVNTHYVAYHGGYTRYGTVAPGYRYDYSRGVVVNVRSNQPVYANPHAVIRPASGVPAPAPRPGQPNPRVITSPSNTPAQAPAKPGAPAQAPAKPGAPAQAPAGPAAPAQAPARPAAPAQAPARPAVPAQAPARPASPAQAPNRPR